MMRNDPDYFQRIACTADFPDPSASFVEAFVKQDDWVDQEDPQYDFDPDV